ncbi:phosphoglycolate phosphatase [Paracoccus sp. (in: a-proteobacteria)]|uniref:phosphoglycolate phosphatase n=1 Tax=Paracoccus sp. TaxID=267 RepID=UPI00396CA191
MNMERPCPIVFDLDGTLIDSAPDIHACVNIVLRQHRMAPLSLTRVRSFIGGGVELLWTRIIAATDIDPVHRPALIAAFMARYHDATSLTRLFPGALEAMGRLADAGHPLGLCTNKPMGPTRVVLEHFGFSSLLSAVIAGDSLPQKKPDPAPLRMALEMLGAAGPAPAALYVGDSEFDAECAAAVPVPFLLFTGGYRLKPAEELPHTARFTDFLALPDLVDRAKAA